MQRSPNVNVDGSQPKFYQLQINEHALVTHIDAERWLQQRWNLAQSQMQAVITSTLDWSDEAYQERFMFWSGELVDTWRALRGKIVT